MTERLFAGIGKTASICRPDSAAAAVDGPQIAQSPGDVAVAQIGVERGVAWCERYARLDEGSVEDTAVHRTAAVAPLRAADLALPPTG